MGAPASSISLASVTASALVERLVSLGVRDAASAGPGSPQAIRVDFQKDGVAGVAQWNSYRESDPVAWRSLAASTARWLHSTGLCARYVASRSGGLLLGWREGAEGAGLFAGLIEGVAHEQKRDPAGDPSWAELPPPQAVGSLIELTADELRARVVAAGGIIQAESLGCPFRLRGVIQGDPGEIWWFSPLFAARLPGRDRFAARRDAMRASGTPVAHAEQAGAGIIGTGGFAVAERMRTLLDGPAASLVVASGR